jgi:FMN-dependent NADH-azoreductase
MKTLLQINASLNGANGQSTQLADAFVAAWHDANPASRIVVRDLAAVPVPHLDAPRFQAFLSKPETRTPEQQAVVDYSDGLIDELRRADVLVLGLPMYNFGVPSTLKAYFDHVARAGVTFRYTASGPVGLLEGKRVVVFAARGGRYQGTALDTQSTYVRDFLGFLGMRNVEIVYAEGLAMSADVREESLAAARSAAEGIVARERVAA